MRERVVTAEVTSRAVRRERQASWTLEDQLGNELLDGAHHRLERARVGGVVGIDDAQPGTARFGLALAKTPRHALVTRFRGRRQYDTTAIATNDDGHGQLAQFRHPAPSSDDGPVGAPQAADAFRPHARAHRAADVPLRRAPRRARAGCDR